MKLLRADENTTVLSCHLAAGAIHKNHQQSLDNGFDLSGYETLVFLELFRIGR
jgi:hypothetical protein